MPKPKLVLMPVGALIVGRLADGEEKVLWEQIKGADLMALREGQARGQTKLESLVLTRLKGMNLEKEGDLQKASPEIKSLAKIEVGLDTQVVLYASETPDGILSARIIREFVRQTWRCSIVMEVVSGLQVEHAGRFRSQGVVRYVQSLVREVNDPANRYGREIILNTTAGFKSLVPYTTLVGLLFGVPVEYIFEFSTEMITLPPLPVSFDQDFIKRVEPLLRRIDQESAVSQDELLKGLSPAERDELLPLLEPVDGDYTMSALGLVVYERYKSPPQLEPSSRAAKDKDHTRDFGQEPHRSPAFERFKARLAECQWVDGFRYLKGTSSERQSVEWVGELLHVTFGRIELEVETMARHESHRPIVEAEVRRLME